MITCRLYGIDAEAEIHYIDLYRKAEVEVDFVDWAEARGLIEGRSIPVPWTGCWLWEAGADKDGYGRLDFAGRQWIATRLSLLAFTGELPEGRFACHRCNVSSCVNPDHLYWGDRDDNARDAKKDGRTGPRPRNPANWGTQSKRKKSVREDMTADALRAMLHYDPASGIFRWHQRPDRGLDWNGRRAGKRAGSQLTVGYRYINVLGKLHLEHRLAWLYVHGEWPPAQIDHIDGDRANNAWENLREATNQQNATARGLRKTNTSGVIGVSWNKKARKWYATVTVHGKMKNLGFYSDKDEAIAARKAAEAEHFGEFAPTKRIA